MPDINDSPVTPNFTSPEELADLRLLHLADSALPIGALAHSFGLESLVAREIVNNASLPNFLRGYIEEAGAMETVFCGAGLQLGKKSGESGYIVEWLALNGKLSARKPGRESREGSGSLGRNFMAAVLALGEFPALRQAMQASRQVGEFVHHSTAFGLSCGVLALDEERALLAYMHQVVASLISACQRLLPLGQSEATAILWNLKPAMIETVKRSVERTIEDVTAFMPLLDWGAMEHPSLSTRLFIS